jgi:sugar/nucleoside kinase (ribokinase family)
MPKFDVSVVGELNLDLIFYGLPDKLELEREHLAKELTITLGSSSAIFTHNLALLGNRVGFSSAIGGDPLGEIALENLARSGADVSGVRRFAGKLTGLTAILPTGSRRYILTYPGTMFDMRFEDVELPYVLDARHLHLSSYYLHRAFRSEIPELFRAAKRAGLTTSLDTNDDPEDLWEDDLLRVLEHVDVLLPNEREACKITRSDDLRRAADVLAAKVPLLVIKRGKQGAIARKGSERFTVEAFPVSTVDSVGAGDSFDAGFVHQYVRGAGVEECLRFASLAGALSTTCAGGTEAFRNAAHRERFLSEPARPAAKDRT